MRYEETPIGTITTRAKRDMDLIRQDVEQKDWSGAIEGVKFQVKGFSELLADLETLKARGMLSGEPNHYPGPSRTKLKRGTDGN